MADRRWAAAVAAALLTGLLTACQAGPGGAASASESPTLPPGSVAASTGPVESSSAALPPAEPKSIAIPAIGVSAPIRRVGLNPDNTVEVPSLERADETGWYEYGPTPGEIGPAVILGHVDSRAGPAVFAGLGRLRPGDQISVTRADGRVAVFRTTAVNEVPKAEFPTERVYGDIEHAGLRLVTCGGQFDRQRSSYLNNVVVYAELVGTDR
ncbi:class F sortase [Virgisporangium aurantiacum]|uniref:Class F sortase n=1 Tax=Virgisporangium aurantiacum TaxID=175570 RepID=A0A8J3ZDW7_9ACTN|nr:class F sortase [Virgisporangium aurantiacum]GIJ62389.1 class F sortase [Virgisporangium aurantiacum]